MLHLCLSASLVLDTGRLHGDSHAAVSYSHSAGGSWPDHMLLDAGLVPVILQRGVDDNRHESDYRPVVTTILFSLPLAQTLPAPQVVVTPCPGLPGTPTIVRIMLRPLMAQQWMPAFSLLGVGQCPRRAINCQPPFVQAATSAGCRSRPAAAASSAKPRRDHRLCFDRKCRDLKWLYQHTPSRDPELARGLRRKCASLVQRKSRQYRQQQTHVLLREGRCRPQEHWQKLNGPPKWPFPRPLSSTVNGSSTWRFYAHHHQLGLHSHQQGAQQAASDLNVSISSAEVEVCTGLAQQ